MNDMLAECTEVTRRFGQCTAVDRVSLRVARGEVVGLLGANGAGKTTLIRIMLGLLGVSSGEVRLFGAPPSRGSRRHVGYLPQGLGLYGDLTVTENLAFARAAFGDQPWHADLGGLQEFAGEVVSRLPLGVLRRAAFAEALAHQPGLLFLDEPTSGVDPLARARLWETIQRATGGGAGALVTTHYMEEAEECDRLVVMANGRVAAEGTASQIVGDARVTVVQADSWAEAFGALEAAGIPVALVGRTLRVPETATAKVAPALGGVPARIFETRATLEERFFQLTRQGQERAAG